MTDLGEDDEERSKIADARMQQYFRHIHSTLEIFKNSVLEIDLTDEGVSVVQRINNAITHATSNDPRGPLRICVVGPLGSGRSTQAKLVAETYNVVHIDVNAMVSILPRVGICHSRPMS